MSPAGLPTATLAAERVAALRDLLSTTKLPYTLPGAPKAKASAKTVVDQLTDYVLPRLASLDAPLLAVVGGSTGAGKSTLVSSLVRAQVAASSAIRPTTRRPLLLHAPADALWFNTDRVLASLARVRVPEGSPPTPAGEVTPREVELRACSNLPAGLALLDAPDVDSVVEENRALAGTLLAGADLWVFVTTAARYADAVPWDHLREAASRDILVAVVLDRVPPGAGEAVEADLRKRLVDAGMGQAPVFQVAESQLDAQGFLPDALVAPLRSWLAQLAADAVARHAVARRTAQGALTAALTRSSEVATELGEQAQTAERLAALAAENHMEAVRRLEAATADGAMLRGEVLARWQEYIGTGELLRALESRVGWLRDRLGNALRGKPAPSETVTAAIEEQLAALVVAECQRAALETERVWRREATAPYALSVALSELPTAASLTEQAGDLVREWQGDVLALVRSEGADRRLTARVLSYGVNGIGLALMVLVFAHTGGLTGSEVGIVGGTAVLAQKVLEAVFGDQAMRSLAQRARQDLHDRWTAVLNQQLEAFTAALPPVLPSRQQLVEAVDAAAAGLQALSQEAKA
ncbi:Predicted GTPase [Actinomyces bovis]|uniref:Predicted GTPase n=1 Tax=Actinomyces bovis TaxID=1658 RepID=A0ABY1VPM4_9ACTO|nr:dynamin family protein [Actinomyces bovis]SPT54076.1 Predicted GTPase [Actinomyces bovis]VEG53726.1 Predicted GTPase [Actinomyces israelii]